MAAGGCRRATAATSSVKQARSHQHTAATTRSNSYVPAVLSSLLLGPRLWLGEDVLLRSPVWVVGELVLEAAMMTQRALRLDAMTMRCFQAQFQVPFSICASFFLTRTHFNSAAPRCFARCSGPIGKAKVSGCGDGRPAVSRRRKSQGRLSPVFPAR